MHELKETVSKARLWITSIIYSRRELLTIIVSALVVLKLPIYLRGYVDASAQVPDIGKMGSLAMAICTVLIVKSLTWFLLRMLWPDLAFYFQNKFSEDFNSLQPCARVLISLGFYCVLFASPMLVLLAFQ